MTVAAQIRLYISRCCLASVTLYFIDPDTGLHLYECARCRKRCMVDVKKVPAFYPKEVASDGEAAAPAAV